jgi:hypothetical protein
MAGFKVITKPVDGNVAKGKARSLRVEKHLVDVWIGARDQ